mmetsp:Transcript_3708/g.11648  ORF Transcript_3708/g.11648 Transcript_3708/m.11648 type:complete len:220 (+) Transcript_3708:1358-2017(+)
MGGCGGSGGHGGVVLVHPVAAAGLARSGAATVLGYAAGRHRPCRCHVRRCHGCRCASGRLPGCLSNLGCHCRPFGTSSAASDGLHGRHGHPGAAHRLRCRRRAADVAQRAQTALLRVVGAMDKVVCVRIPGFHRGDSCARVLDVGATTHHNVWCRWLALRARLWLRWWLCCMLGGRRLWRFQRRHRRASRAFPSVLRGNGCCCCSCDGFTRARHCRRSL